MILLDISDFSGMHGFPHDRVVHPPVFTCDEAERLVPSLPGVHTKSLFVRDKKGRTLVLVVLEHTKSANLKALSRSLDLSILRMASAE